MIAAENPAYVGVSPVNVISEIFSMAVLHVGYNPPAHEYAAWILTQLSTYDPADAAAYRFLQECQMRFPQDWPVLEKGIQELEAQRQQVEGQSL
jgi:hypothetical protein